VTSPRYADAVEQRAAELLPEPVYRYLRQGARDGTTTAEASAAWDRFRFLPQVLRDVTDIHLGTTVLGTPLRSPFAVAPTTMQRAVHPDGEAAMGRGVARADSLMVVSSNAGSSFEDIAATGVAWWSQVYVTADRSACLPPIERAVANGARALVLTADTPVVGTKYDGEGPTVWDLLEPGWLRSNFPAGYGDAAGDVKATDLGPQDVEWLGRVSGLPVVVKGVLRADDARRCVDAGAAAVWVSNHGGRQLDQAAATAERLAALALGARAVFLGRPAVYALAADGADGVTRLFDELDEELEETLRLAGCPFASRVPAGVLHARADVAAPGHE
jgi:4-hydroxymandelate oxidase